MSKKDYVALGDALRETKPTYSTEQQQWRADVAAIAAVLQRNPKFDRERWIAYVNK